MILTAIFLVSLSSLAFEILLARSFSISQWNHLSFMVISIALFGFAASGTVLSILDSKKKGWQKHFATRESTSLLVFLYACSIIISFIVLGKLPLDYFKLSQEPIQAFYLFISYTLLSIPFFFTGLIVLVAYANQPEKTGVIYFASMTGSALGAFMPALLLPFLGEGKLAVVTALIPLCYLFTAGFTKIEKNVARNSLTRKLFFPLLSVFTILLTVSLLLTPWGEAQVAVRPSPYKSLSQLLQFPQATVTESLNSLTGRIETVTSPYIRYAPGLSLKYSGRLPAQKSIFRDGDEQLVLYGTGEILEEFRFAGFTLPAVAYRLVKKPENALLIIKNGGSSIPVALEAGVAEIFVVHGSPSIARAISEHYHLPAAAESPRIFFRQSQKMFDIIHLENWGTSLPGSAALSQEYLFTKEAFSEYLDHLSENGIIIISRQLLLPPSDSIRLFATALEALLERGMENPEQHLMLLRNWGVFTLVVTKKPIENLAIPSSFAEQLNFDIVFIQDMQASDANRFNIFDRPYHYLAIGQAFQHYAASREKKFFEDYLLDVTPQDDLRPFPGRYLKWSRLSELYRSMGNRPYSLLLSGEVVVTVVFFEALGVAALLLIVPGLLAKRRKRGVPWEQKLYFFSIGAGFMFIELYFIKVYVLIFANPVISFSIVLAGILIFSGFGGWCSQKMGEKTVIYSIIVLCLTLLGIYLFIDPLLGSILGLPVGLRYLFALLILIPPGILMGLPFALGMRLLLRTPLQRAYAWAMNGCASVLTSIVAARLALHPGIQSIMVCAIVFYLLAALCSKRLGTKNVP